MKFAIHGIALVLAASGANAAEPLPRGFVEVRPVTRSAGPAVAPLQLASTPFFTYAMPNTYQYFWVNEGGTIVGTNDPGVNPNDGSTHDWRKMPKQAR